MQNSFIFALKQLLNFKLILLLLKYNTLFSIKSDISHFNFTGNKPIYFQQIILSS